LTFRNSSLSLFLSLGGRLACR